MTTRAEYLAGWPDLDLSRTTPEAISELERLWYASLDRRDPDWSIYETDEYVAELWECWVQYSRRHVAAVGKLVERGFLPDVTSVLDLGCGSALTTIELARLWPGARVYGTNPSGRQAAVSWMLGARHRFEIVADPVPVDLVFASEYFEHVQSPVGHLSEVVAAASPRYLVVANSFTARAIGHFDTYVDGAGTAVSSRAIGRRFNRRLRDLGYRAVETGHWNGRPALWVRA